MKTLEEVIKFLEDFIIECEPNTCCVRCDDARKAVDVLKGLLNTINNDLHIPDVSVNEVAVCQDPQHYAMGIGLVDKCPTCGEC